MIRHHLFRGRYDIHLLDRKQVEATLSQLDFSQLAEEAVAEPPYSVLYGVVFVMDLVDGTIHLHLATDQFDRYQSIIIADIPHTVVVRNISEYAADLQAAFRAPARQRQIRRDLDVIYSRPGFEAVVPVPYKVREGIVAEHFRYEDGYSIGCVTSVITGSSPIRLMASTNWHVVVSVDAVEVAVASEGAAATMTFNELVLAAIPYCTCKPCKRGLERLLDDGAGAL